jgi:hypothetical protein
MKIFKAFGTDTKKEQDGVWIDLGDGGSMKIARMGNPDYIKEFQRITKPHRQAIRRGTLSEEVSQDLLVQAMAKHILLDWKGLKYNDGTDIVYSVEEAKKMLSSLKDFRDYVTEMANSAENFKEEVDQETEKN